MEPSALFSVVTARAHAKVNLDLRVLGTRLDGYHELSTVFQTLALHDTLTFRPHEGRLTLDCKAHGVPADEDNLVWMAALSLWKAMGRTGDPTGVAIHLDKRIPPQAGLGGGSSDAAAALLTLVRLWDAPLPDEDLAAIAATLGADVPFFLLGGTAEGRGRGEQLRTLPDLPRHAVLIVVPGFGVSSADAYRWHDDAGVEPPAPGEWPDSAEDWPAALDRCRNDLEGPVVERHPEIGALVELLRHAGARLAAMSGSGSAAFGLFDRVDRLMDAERRLAVAAPGCALVPTATLGREAYRAAFGGPVASASSAGLPDLSRIV